MEIAIILIGLVLFDIAALRWGTDSNNAAKEAGWERREAWRGLSPN